MYATHNLPQQCLCHKIESWQGSKRTGTAYDLLLLCLFTRVCVQGVVSIQVKSLSLPHHSSRPLPAQLDVMEVERSFSSGQDG